MMLSAPLPRYRIYKPAGFYSTLLREILSGKWREGDDVARLETYFTEKLGVAHALATPQARIAIYLAIKAIVGEKKKVLMSPYTIFDVVNMVVCAGGRPVFCDLDPNTCNISADRIEEAIDDETAAVMITHLHGLACDIDRIVEVCKGRGVPLIEDAAQGMSSLHGGRQVGTFGDVGIFSFGLAKNINCVYGGMAVTRSKDLYEKMKAEAAGFPDSSASWIVQKAIYALITDLTLSPFFFKLFFFRLFRFGYLHNVEALNKRVTVEDDPFLKSDLPGEYRRTMSPLQARLVLRQIDRVHAHREKRIKFAAMYYEGLKDIPEIGMPPFPGDDSHAFLQFPIQVADRHALVRHMMKHGRDVAVQHLKNCADLDCFEEFHGDCPVARDTANETVLLPTYPTYSEGEVEENVRAVRSFFGRDGAK